MRMAKGNAFNSATNPQQGAEGAGMATRGGPTLYMGEGGGKKMVQGKSGQSKQAPFAVDEESDAAESPTQQPTEAEPAVPWADERKPPGEDDIKSTIAHKAPGQPPRKESAAAPYGTDLPQNTFEGTNPLPVGRKKAGEVKPDDRGSSWVPWGREDTSPLSKDMTPALWASSEQPTANPDTSAPWQRPDNADETSSFSGKRIGVNPSVSKQDYGKQLQEQMEADARRRAHIREKEKEEDLQMLNSHTLSGLSKGIGENVGSNRA